MLNIHTFTPASSPTFVPIYLYKEEERKKKVVTVVKQIE